MRTSLGLRYALSALPKLSLLMGLVSLGCQESEDPVRPPAIGSGPTPGPRPGPDGLGGADDGGGPAGEETAEGTVVQYRDDAFADTSAFADLADVTLLDPTGTGRVGARYDGTSFIAEGASFGPSWIYVEPDDPSGYPTWTMYTVDETELRVPVVPRAILDEIFLNLTTPAELDVGRAQLVILVVDRSGTPIEGVVADPFTSRPSFIAYKQNASWVSYLEETTSDGLVLIPNLEALGFPGQSAQVILSGAVDAEFDVRLSRGAITLMTHVVP